MHNDPIVEELLRLNQRLLHSVAAADWDTYESLCDPTLTAFEPESAGHLVEGMDFHRFYFDMGGAKGRHNTTMSGAKVRVMGEVAVVSYVRLNQRMTGDGTPSTVAVAETRVWHRLGGRWLHVHFHRSPATPG